MCPPTLQDSCIIMDEWHRWQRPAHADSLWHYYTLKQPPSTHNSQNLKVVEVSACFLATHGLCDALAVWGRWPNGLASRGRMQNSKHRETPAHTHRTESLIIAIASLLSSCHAVPRIPPTPQRAKAQKPHDHHPGMPRRLGRSADLLVQ